MKRSYLTVDEVNKIVEVINSGEGTIAAAELTDYSTGFVSNVYRAYNGKRNELGKESLEVVKRAKGSLLRRAKSENIAPVYEASLLFGLIKIKLKPVQ